MSCQPTGETHTRLSYLLQLLLLFVCVNKTPTDLQNVFHPIRNDPLEVPSQTLILHQCYSTLLLEYSWVVKL